MRSCITKTPSLKGFWILGFGVLCLLVPGGVMGASDPNQVIVNGNIYENIYIALSPEVPMDQCETILNDFELVIGEATALLFNLTNSRVTFPHLFRVVLPSTFTECGTYWTSNTTPTGWQYNKAPLRLGTTHPLFGENMWTRQSGQCGDPGEYISLTPASLKDTSLAARQLVSEWSKYRWGVMDEVGHQGDTVYPPVYEGDTTGKYLPNVCTNVPLNYTLANCNTPSTCSVLVEPTWNPSVKSSIVSVPQLPNVASLCLQGTHNSQALTKHNALCSRLSAFEIFMRHSDYKINTVSTTPTPTVRVTAVLESPVVSSIVFAVENTENMTFYNYQREYLIDALCQTIVSYLQDGVYFGLVHFGATASSVNDTESMGVLDTSYKQQLCRQLLDAFESPSSSPTVSIKNALALASEMLPPDGVIVLITTPGGSSETISSAVAAAGRNSVWPVLYPVAHNQDVSWFYDLAEQTGGGAPQSVAQSLDGNSLQPIVRRELSAALRYTVNMNQQLQLVLTSSEQCTSNETPKNCNMTLMAASQPPSNGYVLNAYYQYATYVTVTPTGLCTRLTNPDLNAATSTTFYCPSMNVSVVLEITTAQSSRAVYSEVIALVQPDDTNTTSITLWSSSSLKNLQYTNTTAPSIFAQVLYEGREVLQAAVTIGVESPARDLVTLQLRDDGTGADVTGNDGVYSAFLVGVSPNVTVTSAGALTLSANASGPGYVMPHELTLDSPNQCCGSLLLLPSSLEATPTFSLNGSAQVKVTSPPPDNLPPGRVSDLTATTSDSSVRLTFTAPGADLDYGMVTQYLVVVYNGEAVTTQVTRSSGLVSSGNIQTVDLNKNDVGCDEPRSYVVSAFDDHNTKGEESNIARYTISCSAGEGAPLTAGSIVGIVLGIILFLILVCLLLFIGCNWEDREDLLVWRILTCASCREKDEKPTKKQSSSPKGKIQASTKPSVTIIRSIDDLNSLPKRDRDTRKGRDLGGGGGRSTRGGRGSGVDNRGFDDNPLHGQLSMSPSGQGRRRYSDSSISSKEGFDSVPYDLRDSSLQMTLPINKVGIPVPEFTGIPLHEERFLEQPSGYPIYPDEPTSYTNPFVDPLIDDPYQQGSHSDFPSSQFDGYNPNMYDSRTNSPSAFPASRLNTQV